MGPELMYLAMLNVQRMRLADPEVGQRATIRQNRSPGTLRRWRERRRSIRLRPLPMADCGGAAA
jgi:hypothetical protein